MAGAAQDDPDRGRKDAQILAQANLPVVLRIEHGPFGKGGVTCPSRNH